MYMLNEESKIFHKYRKRFLISACFSHAYTSLVYGVHASKKACTYMQAFTANKSKKKYFLYIEFKILKKS